MTHPNQTVIEQYEWIRDRGIPNPWKWVQYRSVYTNGEWRLCEEEPRWQPFTEYMFATSQNNGVISFEDTYVSN